MNRCAGDCDQNGGVSVNELITMVSIALGNLDITACEAGDPSGDGMIRIDEIVAGINNALGACSADREVHVCSAKSECRRRHEQRLV